MARVTVEDSLQHVDNRFDLVLVSSKRARDLMMTGEEPMVPWNNDKATVVALREIAEGKIDRSYLDRVDERVVVQHSRLGDIDNSAAMADADAALIAALSAMDEDEQEDTVNYVRPSSNASIDDTDEEFDDQ